MKKNNILIIMVLVLILVSGVYATTYSSSSNSYRVEVSMLNQDPDPVEPGDTLEVRFRIENSGTEGINNLKFELLPKFPFTIYSGDAIKDVGSIDSYQISDDSYVVKYTLKVSEDTVSGENKISARYILDDNSVIDLDYFTININEYSPIVELVSATTTPEEAIPGEKVELKLKVKSLTYAEIRDVKLSLDIEDTTTTTYYFAPLGSSNEQVIESIKPNQEKEVTFNLVSSPDTPINVEKIPVTMTYYDTDGTIHTKNYLIGIKMYEKPSYSLALEDKTVYKELQKGTVTFSIANTGKSNLNYLSVELIDQPLYYTILSNKKTYIGNLESDDFDTAEYEIYSEDSEANKLPLKVKLTYKDDYGKLFEETHEINVELYNKEKAMKYGLEAPAGTGMIINVMILIIVTVFWVSMIMNLTKNKMNKGKKVLWWIIIIGTYVIGAILYYLMARDKGKK